MVTDASLRGPHNPAFGPISSPSPTPPTPDELLDEATWIAWRDSALTPLLVSDPVTTAQTRREFVEGMRLLGLAVAHPHQLLAADVLGAGHEITAILFPRQSGKTETLIIIALGRCALRPRYNAAMTLATLAGKTSEVFDQRVFTPLETQFPSDSEQPFSIYRGKGSEHVRFPNGSRFSAKAPKGAAFRGSSYDFVWIDEAGEATPEQGLDLKGAVLPTFDTRDGGQLVYTGTAGLYRRGLLLWDGLQNAENGRLAYALDEDELTPDMLAAWEPDEENPHACVRALLAAMHPGAHSGLTSLDKLRKRFGEYPIDQFLREYGGIFGAQGEGAQAIKPEAWNDAREEGIPEPPAHFAMAAMPTYSGTAAAIVAAWRDEKGRACGLILDHRPGTVWVAESAASKALRHNVEILYDKKSSDMRVEVEAMERMRPRPRLRPQAFDEVTAGAALLVKEINHGNARHFDQPAMNIAAEKAVRRTTGPSSWALGRPPREDADICPLEAWALALRYYDEHPAKASRMPIMG